MSFHCSQLFANNTALQKKILKYTNDEYDHFLCFLAAESESDIRFASSRLDLAVPELWIFAFLLKSEKKFRAQVIYNYNLDVFLCIFGPGI